MPTTPNRSDFGRRTFRAREHLLRPPVLLNTYLAICAKFTSLKADARFARSAWTFLLDKLLRRNPSPEAGAGGSPPPKPASGNPPAGPLPGNLSPEEAEALVRLARQEVSRARDLHQQVELLRSVMAGEVPVPPEMRLEVEGRTYPPGSWYRRTLKVIQGGRA